MSPTGNAATAYAVALLSAFAREGVEDVVLCPGSRSQALALVAAELERAGRTRLHVRLDERSAGFLALGLAVESRTPVVVLTTSGTAVANLHPAALEAFHSGVPLVLLTADRPEELRGVASNQTTVQPGLFGPVIESIDVPAPEGAEGESCAAAELARRVYREAAEGPRPVHLNVSFRDPLSAAVPDLSGEAWDAPADAAPAPVADPSNVLAAEPVARSVPHGPRTVVVAGHAAGERAEEFARVGGWPLLAEVSSGSRFGPNLVVAFRRLLNDPGFGGDVERAIVFGHPTLTREVPNLLRRDDVEVIVVGPSGGQWYNQGRRAELVGAVEVVGAPEDATAARRWLGRWVAASRGILDAEAQAAEPQGRADGRDFARLELAAMRAPVTRRGLVEAVWRATWPHDRLVLGASRLIREADASVPGKKIRVHANRGLAGIDGTVATATGIALASQRSGAGATRVLIGDLTLLHDAGSLLGGHGEQLPRIQVIVGNDGGGTIFDGLEVARTAAPTAIERVMFTPQSVDIESLARAYGWAYSRAATAGELSSALTVPVTGPAILEVPLAR